MAENQNQVVIELVLDDGTVKKVFGRVVQEAKKAESEVSNSLGGKVFERIESQANAALGPLRGLVSLSSTAALAIGGVAASLAGFAGVFERVLSAEKIEKVNKQFDNLSANAGRFGSDFRKSVQDAIGSQVDFEDALVPINEAIIRLGTNADKIPQLFELARKSVSAFGGDATQTFQAFSQAVQTGNARALRTVGLTVDFDKAQKDLAKSLGVSVQALTEQDKQLANSNALLEVANRQYKDLAGQSTGLTGAFAEFKVAAGDFFDAFAIGVKAVFGPAVEAITTGAAAALRGITSLLTATFGDGTADTQIANLSKELERLLRQQQDTGRTGLFGGGDQIQSQIDAITKKLSKLGDEQAKLNAQSDAASLAASAENTAKRAEAVAIEQQKGLAAFNSVVDEINKLRVQSLSDAIAAETDLYQKSLLTVERNAAQRLAVETDFQAKASALFEAAKSANLLSTEEYATSIQQLQELKLLTLSNIGAQTVAVVEQNNSQIISSIKATASEGEKIVINFGAALAQVGVAAAATLGRLLVSGGISFKALAGTIISTIGGILIQIGTFVITATKAIEALKATLAGLPGGIAIAAGLAAIVVGGALQAIGSSLGSNSSVAGTSFASTGGPTVGTFADPVNIATNDVFNRPTEPETVINVNIGNLLTDNDETGLKIVELINSVFDSKGATIRQGAFA